MTLPLAEPTPENKIVTLSPDLARRLFRFRTYLHAVPLSPVARMEWMPATLDGSELGIVWLRPRADYPLYLRESDYAYDQKATIRRRDAERQFDGDPTDHVVAIAVLRPETHWDYGFFQRRTWWVKSYDAFHGYRVFKNQNGTRTWYNNGGPCEAVKPQTIWPNSPTIRGWNDDEKRTETLRVWNGEEPKLHQLSITHS